MAENPLLRALKRSPARLTSLDDDFEEDNSESILGAIGRRSLSGLAKVGNLLDVPGSAVRDLMVGANPFDQLLSPFSDENRTSGRELLRTYGMAGREDSYGNFFGGLGAEIALDPTTYLTLGASALTRGGKVAKAAGLLGDAAKLTGKGTRVARLTTKFKDLAALAGDEATNALTAAATKSGTTLDDIGEETLGSLAHVGIPFTDVGVNIGTGPLAQRAAGYLDTAGEAIRWSPIGRAAHGLFGPASKGLFDKGGQQLAEATSALEPQATRKARKAVADIAGPLTESYQEFDSIFGPEIRTAAKGKLKDPTANVASVLNRTVGLVAELGGDVDEAFTQMSLPLGKLTPELRSKLVKLGDDMQKGESDIADLLIAKGGNLTKMEGLPADATSPAFEHLTAYGAQKPATLGGAFKTLFTKPGAFSAREEVTKNIPREIVNQIVSSDEFRGRGATQKLLAKYGKYLGRGTELLEDGTKKPIWESAEKHAKALVDHIKNRDQFPIYNSSQLENFGRYMKEAHLANVNYDVIHETLAKNLDDAGIPVKEVFTQAGMDATKAMEWLSKKTGIGVDELAAKGIPEDVANAIVAVRKASSDPEWMGAIGGFIDQVTKLFKENVTLPFPSFWGRNLSSGMYVNAVSGLMENAADFGAYKDAIGKAFQSLRSGDSSLLSELFVEGVIDDRMLSEGVEASIGGAIPMLNPSGALGGLTPGQTVFAADRGNYGKVISSGPTTSVVKFTSREGVTATVTLPNSQLSAGGSAMNPLRIGDSFMEARASVEAAGSSRIPGLDALRTAHGTVLRTGEKASAAVEFMNRVPMYLYLTEAKGWAPEAAAAKVKELHVDYSALAPFERQVMKRLVPFYSFQRRAAPMLLGILAERPGGAMAQTIRAARESSGADASTPDWIASTAAIPNPFKSVTEGASYISGFGLPFEQFLQYGEGGLRGALREGLSQTNPLVKAPLEMATNQSFFQTGPSGAGRPLDDLDPVMGRTLANIAGRFGRESTKPIPTPDILEWAVSNSPLTRAASTMRQVTDPRKSPLDLGLNLLTGVRVSDVSPAAQDAVLRDRALEMMRGMGSRAFTKSYFAEDDLAQMPAPQRALAEKLTELQSLLAQRAKERRVAANR